MKAYSEIARRKGIKGIASMTTHRHAETTEYADELISVPRAGLALSLAQTEAGVTLWHGGRELARCDMSAEGMLAAGFIAQALGLSIPPLGGSVEARASTGVLFRALSIAELDFNNPASLPLLERLLEEAEMQRRG